MMRLSLLVVGATLLLMPIVVVIKPSAGPTPAELALARGGDPTQGMGSDNCDEESGIYIGCQVAGGVCKQCITYDENDKDQDAISDTLSPIGPKGTTGYMRGQNSQDCGTIFLGKCVVNAAALAGFDCIGADTGQICTQGILEIVPQPAKVRIGNPTNPRMGQFQ